MYDSLIIYMQIISGKLIVSSIPVEHLRPHWFRHAEYATLHPLALKNPESRVYHRMKTLKIRILICVILALAACQSSPQSTSTPTSNSGNLPTLAPTPEDPGVLAPRGTPDLAQLPLLEAYLERVQTALQQPVPILTLEEGLDETQQLAQSLAVNDSRFQTYIRDPETGAPLRSEIFGVYPMRPSDITDEIAGCRSATCYRVEMYNYALNFYLAAAVDTDAQTVLGVSGYANSQPDIPNSLTEIALEIAIHSPQVIQALGYTPQTGDALMANTKTALNDTVCERSRHLCVAPTFVAGEQALWAIVDLTDGRVVGVRWTEVGSTMPLTEKSLQNESMMRLYCQRNNTLIRDEWRMDYILTSSDGLRISDVRYQGKTIFESVKLVDWHVNYSESDGFGYSDAIGCPVFSQAAVIAVGPPRVEDIVVGGAVTGFALVQEFWSEQWPLPCNYYYEQRYEFYNDGRFRPVAMNVGRGCGDDGTYRPVTRIALADSDYTFSQWNGTAWEDWQTEGWRLTADVTPDAEGSSFRLTQAGAGYSIMPSTGQFGDGGRGDNAYIYVTRRDAARDEGDSDMPTIGSCCNTDYQQGPEKFIDPTPEAITDSGLVIWYVAQLDNDGGQGSEYCWAESVLENGIYVPREYPCASGPMFVPIHTDSQG
jgi:hypothetical protein